MHSCAHAAIREDQGVLQVQYRNKRVNHVQGSKLQNKRVLAFSGPSEMDDAHCYAISRVCGHGNGRDQAMSIAFCSLYHNGDGYDQRNIDKQEQDMRAAINFLLMNQSFFVRVKDRISLGINNDRPYP